MKSPKPYLVRALHEWISDNGLTPYLLVNAEKPHCQVPQEHVKNGQIVLNITHGIVNNLVMNNDAIEFAARFSGVSRHLYIPVSAVLAIYAKENGQGMSFADEPEEDGALGDTIDNKAPKGKPQLKIVK